MYKKPSQPNSARRKVVSTPVSSNSSKSFEVQNLQLEVNELKSHLSEAMLQVAEVKKQQIEETKSLRQAYEGLKKDLDTLKFEREEQIIKQNNGVEEYSKLTLELIKLRTEIDRISNLYEREKRVNHMRLMESKIQEENLIDDFN